MDWLHVCKAILLVQTFAGLCSNLGVCELFHFPFVPFWAPVDWLAPGGPMGAANPTISGETETQVRAACQPQQPYRNNLSSPCKEEAKFSRSPTWWKLVVEAEHKENLVQGSDKKPSVLETGTANNELSRSSCGSVSDSRRPLFKVGGRHSYGWKDICLTKS